MWLLFELGCPGLFGLHPPLCTVSLPLHLQRSAAVPLNESYFDRAVVVRDECGTVESAVYLVPVPVSPPCSTHTLHSRSHLSDVVHRGGCRPNKPGQPNSNSSHIAYTIVRHGVHQVRTHEQQATIDAGRYTMQST